MASFLKFVSTVYLILLWLPLGLSLFGVQFPGMTALQEAGAKELAFIFCLALSILAVPLFTVSNQVTPE